MKKGLLLTALAIFVAVPAMAAIKETKHNLGTTGDYTYVSSGATQICIFCHTPHNPTMNIPLWNRNNPTGGFAMYTGSPTLQLTAGDLSADSISRFCLSCHDGVTALGNVRNTADQTTPMLDRNLGGITGRTNIGGGAAADLTNDHPVNFRYSVAQAGDRYLDATADVAANLRLFRSNKDGDNTDYIECASCHDPHGAGFAYFLRKSNESSSLCLTCHTK